MSSCDSAGSPRKRIKLSAEMQTATEPISTEPIPSEAIPTTLSHDDRAAHIAKEGVVGITDFVSTSTPGFSGVLKKRYTDFLVNEILPNGKVVHLQSVGSAAVSQYDGESQRVVTAEKLGTEASVSGVPDPSAMMSLPATTKESPQANNGKAEHPEEGRPVSVEDMSKLMTYLNERVAEELLALYKKILASPSAKPRDHGFVTSPIPADKAVRTALHEDIRRIFTSKIESSTDMDKKLMTFSAAVPQQTGPSKQRHSQGKQVRGKGKLGWADRGGEFIHFTIYKENKDTMEVISYLARQLQMNAKAFQFAGTKDRRAVTVQRASAYRVEGHRLSYQNRLLRNASVGDFEYQKRGLELGDLKGNEFVITLRDCQLEHAQNLPSEKNLSAIEKVVFEACQNLHQKGFFNYYGMQRFGTFSTRTDAVGVKLLQEDFQGACEAILHYSPNILAAAQDAGSLDQISSDDKARAEAIHIFQQTGRLNEALNKLPKKFSAEGNIIRHLARNSRDYFGAIQMIQRNLRLMYVHAYQSLVWNFAVGERWKLFGDQVVEGDLVLVNEHKEKEPAAGPTSEEVDADGEIIVQPTDEDRAQAVDDQFERARALTADEAASGEYNIFDVVLPLPGYDILYPKNGMTDFYKNFMGHESRGGLDPFAMRRKQKDFSLSGGYRKVLARIESGYDVRVRAYKDDNEQFVRTDMEVIKQGSSDQQMHDEADQDAPAGDKLAVILKMQLGSSQYATMALRELSKSGIQQYKPDFGGGR